MYACLAEVDLLFFLNQVWIAGFLWGGRWGDRDNSVRSAAHRCLSLLPLVPPSFVVMHVEACAGSQSWRSRVRRQVLENLGKTDRNHPFKDGKGASAPGLQEATRAFQSSFLRFLFP